ncbi:Rap1a/Tai family immunity protein [Tardiphaga sp. P9-11]|jgi:hypothetical protein|uniref:Rap1a/Tai family immunity protein n=1 Tax=Tardiphaga sp. P9-11 TaxID=2024614 RepID=UPI0011F24481|nr:Rap1a/Tai family immunity protein [Tardiphaga sp. P9-11]KAA0073990.1 hypothetical protein CIW50_18820 [Tardiphaga sp. P9-11]
MHLTADPRIALPSCRMHVTGGTKRHCSDFLTMLTSTGISTSPRFSRLIRVILSTMILFMSHAHADGIRMAELCNRSHRDLVSMYVEGALDNAESDTTAIMSDLEKALEGGSSEIAGLKRSWKLVMSYCPPSRFKADQAADIFCDFLMLNPQKRKSETIALLNEALQNAWPCSTGQKK